MRLITPAILIPIDDNRDEAATEPLLKDVIPAQAGIQKLVNKWIPACAGMTMNDE